MLCSKYSQRRIAIDLNINKKTVARKLRYLAKKSRNRNENFKKSVLKKKVLNMQFDDLITLEHTKMKPLSVSLAVDKDRRFILGAHVSRIPAFGHLAKKSKKRYGMRQNHHRKGLAKLFEEISPLIDSEAIIESDEHKMYPQFVLKHLSTCKYKRYAGGRSCIAGQGELKKKGYDPFFILNHTCAMLRDSINRLVRKTWCSTKNIEILQDHIDTFIAYYNLYYLPKKKSAPI